MSEAHCGCTLRKHISLCFQARLQLQSMYVLVVNFKLNYVYKLSLLFYCSPLWSQCIKHKYFHTPEMSYLIIATFDLKLYGGENFIIKL